ncbi:phage holin family protein [Planococcus sp. CP5-4]|nr:phage holin family protein [Planococcus sp. CP5-4_YE]MBV0910566.1 phage holin family protein [Planococcus sp. CP5-4_UN]MBW6065373.1 phage holin family protein [Planococcus sp. CP5-4]
MVVNEGLSILENCAQMGSPIPPVLYNALAKLNRDTGGKEQQLLRDLVLEQID